MNDIVKCDNIKSRTEVYPQKTLKGCGHDMKILQYKGYDLSEFQTESIEGILNDQSVILSTHTGNGKSLVGDYAVNECFNRNLRVVYTAPIKALSNQKYNQFVKEYGEDSVGLVTGDRVINQNAPILVVTTEILRNMIHESAEKVEDIKFIILDEIHYISNEERGTVWEEVIIFKNKDARIIGLSATIPNIDEICDWISNIHQEDIKKVYYPERIVKQKHFYFDKKLIKASYDQVIKNHNHFKEIMGFVPYRNSHIDFIKYAQNVKILPVLYFVFSRSQCENKAVELSIEVDLLNEEEKDALDRMYIDFEQKYPEIMKSKSWKTLKNITYKGIGFHHAGLLPIIKQFMESVFEQKLCKVLYATETFAVGINFPVKTTCFDSLRKYDGKSFRNLLGSEYLQMAGRAGRRGIDKFGMVFVLVDYKDIENGDFLNIEEVSVEPTKSQFTLSYNTLLNLVRRYSDEEIELFFNKSLANFQYLRSLKQYENELQNLKNQYESNGIPNQKCKIEDYDCCPVVYKRNKEKLKMYQVMLNNKKISEADKKIIQREIDQLKYRVNKKCHKCPHSQKRLCEENIKEQKKKQKAISRKEKLIQREIENRPEIRFKKDFDKKYAVLKNLGYISDDRTLLIRGEICSKLHVQEVLVTELLLNGFFHDTDEDIINGVAAGIVFEDETFACEIYPFKYDLTPVFSIMEVLNKEELSHGLAISNQFLNSVCGIMYSWSSGEDMFEIVEKTKMSEGDFVSLCRRTVDLLKQIRNAVPDDRILKDKLNRCIAKIDRDIVKLGL